jgi:hypothetical protein
VKLFLNSSNKFNDRILRPMFTGFIFIVNLKLIRSKFVSSIRYYTRFGPYRLYMPQ